MKKIVQKSEFEEMLSLAFSDADYQVIHEVYMWHPVINDIEEVAELYKSFGMVLFYDLFPRAEKLSYLTQFLVLDDEDKRAVIRQEIDCLLSSRDLMLRR